MKKFLILIIVVIGLDQATGFLLNRLYLRTTSGESGGLINYALHQQPDVLVLGSSRAKHHVSPDILQARLSASVFNAGINGQDFLYAIMLLDLWTQSHPPPKMILLHVDPDFLSRKEEEIQNTSVFSAYYTKSERVRGIIMLKGKFEWLKYYSSSYRFNGKIYPLIKNLMMSPDPAFNGYSGLKGSLNFIPGPVDGRIPTSEKIDAPWGLKLKYLYDLADYCKHNGVRLILFHSPRFQEDTTGLVAWSSGLSVLLAPHEGIEFLDLARQTHDLFAGRPELFRDFSHLNTRGSELFSTLLADEIAKRMDVKRRPLETEQSVMSIQREKLLQSSAQTFRFPLENPILFVWCGVDRP